MRRVLILAVICLLCFTGCSKRKENDIEAPTVTGEVQQTETETEALQTTETEPESEEVDVLSFYEWEVTNDGIKITNYKGNEERVVMPSIIDNKMVVEMKSGAFNGNVFMKEFVASEYMRYAEGNFHNCPNLTYIEFPGAERLWGEIDSPTCERLVMPKCGFLIPGDFERFSKYTTGLKVLEVPSLELLRFDNCDYSTSLEKVVLPEDYATRFKLYYDDGKWMDPDTTHGEAKGAEKELSPGFIPVMFGCKTLEVNGTVFTAE